MKKRRKLIWALAAAAVIVIAVIILMHDDEELVVRTYTVEDYTVINTVTATGTIQPVEQVTVGTQVSGEIDKIFVDYNSEVKKDRYLPSWTSPIFWRMYVRLKHRSKVLRASWNILPVTSREPSCCTRLMPRRR